MTVLEDRATQLDTLHLDKGDHSSFAAGHCVMEVAAWLAGEPHTDKPDCVAPPLRRLMIGLNDRWDDQRRQQLKPYVTRVIGTAGDGQDQARSYLALDWLIRTFTPAWLDLAGLTAEAQSLRQLRRIVDFVAAKDAAPAVRKARSSAAAAWAAARAAAGDAWAAAWAAAADAAWAAAAGDAWAAAWVAAADAAWAAAARDAWAAADAAGGAAWAAAARDAAADAAAGDAARAALQPTVEQLQTSALHLLDTMINPRAAA